MAALPPGPLPEDINKGPELVAACVTLTAIALTLVVTRMYVRIHMVKCVGMDDYAICAAMLVSLVSLGTIGTGVHYGAGRHAVYIKPEVLVVGLKLNFITQTPIIVALALVKLSICFSFLRFAEITAWYRFIVCLIVVTIGILGLSIFALYYQCRPIQGLWTPGLKMTCLKPSTLYALLYFICSVGIVSDAALALLPIPIFWSLHIQRRVKIGLIVVMGLGIFASGAAIVKTTYLSSYGKHGDFLWDSVHLTIWAVAEQNVGIAAASIPTIRPLFKAFRSLYGSGSGRNTSNRYSVHWPSYVSRKSHSRSIMTHDARTAKNPTRSDGESEDIILEGRTDWDQIRGKSRITKTIVVESSVSSAGVADHEKRKWVPEP